MEPAETDAEYGVPDEDSPEITEEQFQWMIHGRDFPDFMEGYRFLVAREAFLRAAEEAGIARSAFLGLEPNKPGFLDRAKEALTKAVGAAEATATTLHAAE